MILCGTCQNVLNKALTENQTLPVNNNNSEVLLGAIIHRPDALSIKLLNFLVEIK